MKKRSNVSVVKCYKLPLDQIHMKYGRPGEFKEKTTPTIADVDGLAQRRAMRREMNG